VANEGKNLTLLEASSIIAGNGIGGGIMAVPFLVSLNGIPSSLLVIGLAYLISVLLHLMIAEVATGSGDNPQVVEIFSRYLFRGRWKAPLTWAFFGIICLVFFATLAGYIAGAGEILSSLLGIPSIVSQLVFYVLGAGVAFFGLKAIGISEKLAILGMGIVFILFFIVTLSIPLQPLPMGFSLDARTLALFGMVMFSFAAFFAVPQAVTGLRTRPRLIPMAIVLGIGINLLVVLAVSFLSLLASKQVTEIAMIGWSQAIGPWAAVLGAIFTVLAMITSYWSISYALMTILQERFPLANLPAWLIATLPTLLVALFALTGFLGFMRLAGGGIAVLIALLFVPTYWQYRKANAGVKPLFLAGVWSHAIFQWVAMAGYLAMAVGSFISIE